MIMPIANPVVSSGHVLTLGAVTLSTNTGYGLAAIWGVDYGSLTPDTTSNGNLISSLGWQGSSNTHAMYVADAEPALSTITIDGTPYALTFALTTGGYDLYSFSTGVQRIFSGNTYSVELS